jgi:hypothetical protein
MSAQRCEDTDGCDREAVGYIALPWEPDKQTAVCELHRDAHPEAFEFTPFPELPDTLDR